MNEARNVTRDKGSDTWFPTSREAESTAKAVSVACPVRRDCLSYALASPDLVGIWAGMKALGPRVTLVFAPVAIRRGTAGQLGVQKPQLQGDPICPAQALISSNVSAHTFW